MSEVQLLHSTPFWLFLVFLLAFWTVLLSRRSDSSFLKLTILKFPRWPVWVQRTFLANAEREGTTQRAIQSGALSHLWQLAVLGVNKCEIAMKVHMLLAPFSIP
ncbi:hypothetical protein L596_005660 [Steinernema carpocapsae]|uniref:Uncharacterized protein n=1 Tax=Steinernema carpocapsae TaxID=34508 RepID=A0A4U8V1B9_STECR|nr:hypothetical protein L596_005660 [Steinernema carpocapsae]